MFVRVTSEPRFSKTQRLGLTSLLLSLGFLDGLAARGELGPDVVEGEVKE